MAEVYSIRIVLLPQCLYIHSIWKTAFIFLCGKNSRYLYYLISDPYLMVQSVLKLKEVCFSNVILFTYQCMTATWIILLLLLDINLSCTNVFINTCILLLSISIKILKNNRLFFTNSKALLCVLSTPWCVFMYWKVVLFFLSVVFVNTWHQFVHIFFVVNVFICLLHLHL